MSVWVLHRSMTPEEEERISTQNFLPLPLEDTLPDLTAASTPAALLQLLQSLDPDAPPETIARLMERTWRLSRGLEVEDTIVVLLQGKREAALAEVTGGYHYHDGVHTLPVKWYDKRIPFSKFGRHKELLKGSAPAMIEVTTSEARAFIRDRLPHRYNRFVHLKWILIVFVCWRIVVYIMEMLKGTSGQ